METQHVMTGRGHQMRTVRERGNGHEDAELRPGLGGGRMVHPAGQTLGERRTLIVQFLGTLQGPLSH